MNKYDENKANEIRDTIKKAFISYVYNKDVQKIIVSDLETDEDGDIYIRVDIRYRRKALPLGKYYIWESYTRRGWRNTIYLMARLTRDALKGMRAIDEGH